MAESENILVRNELVRSLEGIYQLRAFSALAELLQGESLVLQYLAAHQGEEVYPSVLSSALHLSRSRITGTLNSLRGKDCVAMEPSLQDRRMVRVAITEAGRELIQQQMGGMLAYFDRMIAGLGVDSARTLIELIDRCVAVMED